MKTTPLPEILKAANLGNLYADLAHSIINPPPVGIEPQGRDLVAIVLDCNLGHERAAAAAALLAHAANVLPGLVEALRDVPDTLETLADDSEEAGWPARARNARKLAGSLRKALSLATNVPTNS